MGAKKPTAEQIKAQRRKRIAIILGYSFIVFVFILRDVLRESVRERLDAVRVAQITYLSRFGVTTVLNQMMDFRKSVETFIHRSESHETTKEASEEDKLAYEMALLDQLVTADRAMLQNDETLVLAIDEHWDEYREIRRTSDAVANTLSQIENRTDESPDQRLTDILKLRVTEDPLFNKIGELGLHAFDGSKELTETLEKRYQYINWFFYVAFSIGVAVNLWGALSGVEIEED